MTSSQQGRGRGSPIGAVLAIGMLLAGCGDFGTGPDGPSASARGDPVVIEGITVKPPPGGCRSGSCADDGAGAKPPPDGNDGSTRQGGGGAGAGREEDGPRACLAALAAHAAAGVALKTANAVRNQERREFDAAQRRHTDLQKKYAPNGINAQEARQLAEQKAEVARQQREYQLADRASSAALSAVFVTTGAVVKACGFPP